MDGYRDWFSLLSIAVWAPSKLETALPERIPPAGAMALEAKKAELRLFAAGMNKRLALEGARKAEVARKKKTDG